MPPAILFFAIPFFVLLLSIEAYFAYREQKHQYEFLDTFSSLALGIGNVLSGFVTKAIIFGLLSFIYQYRVLDINPSTWWFWVLLFFADDFSYYWFHRTSHRVGWFWASHVVHHSSMHYNLAAALRQTWTGNLTGAFLFWAWMPLVGFPPLYVLFMQQISLIYQFWIHTEWIDKLPRPFEFVLNTPSHHRVHHGSDAKYLDRNHGGVLIIWDRLFGTFQAEEEKPTYGLTANIGSFNPFKVAFKTWQELFAKARSAGSWKLGLRYFIAPPGWSPTGFGEKAEGLRKKEIAVTKQPPAPSEVKLQR